MNRTDFIDQPSLRDDVPVFAPGDTLKVHVKVIEGARERVQVFQGAVIRRQGSGARETFTVRKVSFGVGVERTFPVHSPVLEKIEVVSRGQVRRAKLYYLRDRIGKAAKIKEKRTPRPEGKKGKSASKAEKPVTAEVRPETESPNTEGPVTESPVTESPVTESPVTESPVTESPVTESPVTESPVTESPDTADSGA